MLNFFSFDLFREEEMGVLGRFNKKCETGKSTIKIKSVKSWQSSTGRCTGKRIGKHKTNAQLDTYGKTAMDNYPSRYVHTVFVANPILSNWHKSPNTVHQIH